MTNMLRMPRCLVSIVHEGLVPAGLGCAAAMGYGCRVVVRLLPSADLLVMPRPVTQAARGDHDV